MKVAFKYKFIKLQSLKFKAQGSKLFCVFFITLLLFGCEKIIDVDLNEADPSIVIEGNLSGFPSLAEVKITKTSNYFDNSESEKISDARVTIDDNKGNSFILTETETGVYNSSDIRLKPNANYRLKVESGGEYYEATSKFSPKVAIDSVGYYWDNQYSFFDEGFVVLVFINDPPGIENYYRLRIFVNDELQNSTGDFILFSDRFIDGQQLELTIHEIDLVPNDTVTVQLMSLDKNMYNYYNVFEELMNNNPGSAAPANPPSNISNGALGYFSVWSYNSRRFIIRE